MTVLFTVLFLLALADLKVKGPEEFYEDYLTPRATVPVKGIFVLIVFFRHVSQYVDLNQMKYSVLFLQLNKYIGQTLVAMFLFYSGFGVMEAARNRGRGYVRRLPIRIFRVWLHFAIAVMFYLVRGLAAGKVYDRSRIALSLIGVKSLGNSNWYIFIILVCYFVTFICLMLTGRHLVAGQILTTILSIGLIVWMKDACDQELFPSRFYNTLICYCLGGWYALIRDRAERFLMRRDLNYYLALTGLGVVYFFSGYRKSEFLNYEIWVLAFTGCVLLLSMKLVPGSGLLKLLGSHVFGMYIMQRLVMLITESWVDVNSHPFTFVLMSFLGMILVGLAFDSLMSRMDAVLFSGGKKNAMGR